MKLSQELIAILAVGVTLMGMVSALFVSIGRMGTRLRGDMSILRDEMRGEMSVLRDEMRGEMSILRDDIRHDIDALRIDIRDIREDVRQLRDKLLVPASGQPATG